MKIPLPCWRWVWNSPANSLKQFTKLIHTSGKDILHDTYVKPRELPSHMWSIHLSFIFRICLKSPAWGDHTATYKAPPVFSCIQLQSYHAHGLLQRKKSQLTYGAVARKDERKAQNMVTGGQQTKLWPDHWCCAVSSPSKCLFSQWFRNTHRSH